MASEVCAVSQTGVVVIGRNEGGRLRRCIASLRPSCAAIVYVDSGSTDGSAERARADGVDVVELDLSVPFTAARARNAGFARLAALHPDIELVQFVDGDCEVAPGWIPEAARALGSDPRLAVVCGRRRERHPEASLYNRLCDIEWDTPVGAALYCGGDALMRAAALREVGGYRDGLIAGEEPELCVRLRRRGWTIQRLPLEMTLHDAAMTRFGQWWRRAVRAGHAFAEGYSLHGAPPERMWLRPLRSAVLSGAAVPALALAAGWPTRGASLLLLLWYPAMLVRYARGNLRRGMARGDGWTYAAFCVLAAFPQVAGAFRYLRTRLTSRRPQLIEYKDQGPRATP